VCVRVCVFVRVSMFMCVRGVRICMVGLFAGSNIHRFFCLSCVLPVFVCVHVYVYVCVCVCACVCVSACVRSLCIYIVSLFAGYSMNRFPCLSCDGCACVCLYVCVCV